MKNKNILLIIGSGILIVIGILFIGLTSAADETKQEENRRKIELRQSSTTTSTSQKLSFYIDDRAIDCQGDRELIYEDGTLKYYLSCNKSSSIYLVYNDNHEITLKEALSTNSITIKELIDNGLDVIEEAV